MDEYNKAQRNSNMAMNVEKAEILIRWNPQEKNWVKLNTNEASKDNESSGYSGIIRDMHGKCKGGYSNYLGICSAFGANLWGIHEGLNIAIRLGMMKVEMSVDSNVIVTLLEARKFTNINGFALLKQFFHLLGMHEKVKVTHTYREGNRCLNALAKSGVVEEEDIVFQDDVLDCIKHIVVLFGPLCKNIK